jgi:hypothetical protein
MTQRTKKCETCRFLQPNGLPANGGSCHRYGPIDDYGGWPRVKADDWCGDYELRPEACHDH